MLTKKEETEIKEKILDKLEDKSEEKKFLEEIEELGFSEGLVIPVYYSLSEDPPNEGKVLLDEESMTGEFENKLREIKEILEYINE